MKPTDSYWTDKWGGTQHGPFDDILGSEDGQKPKRDYA